VVGYMVMDLRLINATHKPLKVLAGIECIPISIDALS
jgi:hypothetical protein